MADIQKKRNVREDVIKAPTDFEMGEEELTEEGELYYFSGTGNGLHVARELQKRIPETSLIPIIGTLKHRKVILKADRVASLPEMRGDKIFQGQGLHYAS